MTWFFVNAGQQAGPISDIQLDEYILGGKILPDTLIWREGMESWLPCKDARPAVAFKARPTALALTNPAIGNFIAAFDNERRTVHDHIAGTRVIKV